MTALCFFVALAIVAPCAFLIGKLHERDKRRAEPVMVPSAWQLRTWRKERR